MHPLRRASLLFSITITLSSFLLFLIEPMIGKLILPSFGGAASVWTTCLVFFQTALLIGYLSADWLGRHRLIHSALLLASMAALPTTAAVMWTQPLAAHPVLRILTLLTLSIGLPFLLLSANAPLLQQRLAQSGASAPYWLYVVSNAASLAGLFAYPVLIETHFTLNQQRWIWFALFLAVACLSIVLNWNRRPTSRAELPARSVFRQPHIALWFGLAAAGSMLLLSVTNHLTSNVAPVPFLWILPLAVYLFSYMLAFTRLADRRTIWIGAAIFGLLLLANTIYDIDAVEPIQIVVPILLFSLFTVCLFCHTELYRRRPSPESLPIFYIAIAAGGAAGSILVGIVAPSVFTGISELPFTMTLVATLAIAATWSSGRSYRLLWTGVAAAMAALLYMNLQAFSHGAIAQRRSFYGALRVIQSGLGDRQIRTLFHGTIEHGAQFLLPPWRFRPTTYYGPDSGVGIALRECMPQNKRVGVIGLGAGTLAAYGAAGDYFRFYEINPQVADIAETLFWYLRESKAQVSVKLGDGRLSLRSEPQAQFNLLAIDAFSGDAIPVHLVSREALQLYRAHLTPDGVLAFHVSNNFLDLASVIRTLASDADLKCALIRNHDDPDAMVLASDWVLVTSNEALLENPGLQLHRAAFATRTLPVWTDNYSNLLQILKTPSIH